MVGRTCCCGSKQAAISNHTRRPIMRGTRSSFWAVVAPTLVVFLWRISSDDTTAVGSFSPPYLPSRRSTGKRQQNHEYNLLALFDVTNKNSGGGGRSVNYDHDDDGEGDLLDQRHLMKNDLSFVASTASSSDAVVSRRSAFLALLATAGAAAIPSSVVAEQAGSNKNKNDVARQESLSGLVAGAALTVTKTVVKYPLDTATVRLQMPNSSYSISNLPQLLDGSYRGVLAPLLANLPAGAVFFAVKDAVKAELNESTTFHSSPKWLRTALAVAVAQVPYWLVRNPSEVVKTRQQAGRPGYSEEGVAGVVAAYRQVLREPTTTATATTKGQRPSAEPQPHQQTTTSANGVDAFYIGYWENILYAYPADVIKFVAYEQLTGGRGKSAISPAEGAMAGAAATALAQLVTTPLDVVRNRIMAQQEGVDDESDNADRNSRQTAPPSYTERLVQLARQEGVRGLFAGAAPRVGKALLSGAIQFATYEETKQKIAAQFFPKPPSPPT